MHNNYYLGKRPEVFELIQAHAPAPQKILEIGCGNGGFRENFPKNVEYWGVETHTPAAKNAEKSFSRVFNCSYEDAESSIPDGYFDIIICNDVIEHINDHVGTLSLLKKKLNNNGCIAGSIPNVRYFENLLLLLLHKNWKYTDEGILDRTHLRFFTEKSINETLVFCGYNIQNIQGINPLRIKLKLRSWQSIKRFLLFRILGKDTRFLQFFFIAEPRSDT